MTRQLVLAIDQGTTNTKALLISDTGEIQARASSALTTAYPHPGWAEQSATDIWVSVQAAIADVVTQSKGATISAIGITNQRETLVVWDARTSQPICPAIIWQCRRTSAACAALVAKGHNDKVIAATGLGINPLFPATKLAWVLENLEGARDLATAGHLRAGTVDAWLLWKLTGGASFATDHSNASRTQLFDTGALQFSAELCALFSVPLTCLPQTMPSDAAFGETVAGSTALPAGVPIRAMMGDSHAALYGHGVRVPGTVKATYGTGSSLMTLTPGRMTSAHGLSGTIAWTAKGRTTYALEGNITVSAQAAAFMATILGLSGPAALSDLALAVPDSGGVAFVPALAGLGAPHWDDYATGTITGMTHATGPAHLARATFDAIAFQIADVFDAMEADIGHAMTSLRADGGAAGNDLLMQIQADILGCEVLQSAIPEIGALGVASMALGVEIGALGQSRVFAPITSHAARHSERGRWTRALARARS